jgi:hypothetical protein
MTEFKENYDCCPSSAKNEHVKKLQNLSTPCGECASIYYAKKNRTDYDKFWIKFYNTKAQNTPTNLLDLQFAA